MPMPGAVVLRSDIERKAMFSVAETETLADVRVVGAPQELLVALSVQRCMDEVDVQRRAATVIGQPIVVHRLLKNDVVEELDMKAYALISQACIEASDIEPADLGMVSHTETYERIGKVVARTGNAPAPMGGRCTVYVDARFVWEYENERKNCDVRLFCGDEYLNSEQAVCNPIGPFKFEMVSFHGVNDQRHTTSIDFEKNVAKYADKADAYAVGASREHGRDSGTQCTDGCGRGCEESPTRNVRAR